MGERGGRTELELRERRVAVRNTLDPLRLVGLAVQRQAPPCTVAQLGEILLLLPLVLGPAPEPDLLMT